MKRRVSFFFLPSLGRDFGHSLYPANSESFSQDFYSVEIVYHFIVYKNYATFLLCINCESFLLCVKLCSMFTVHKLCIISLRMYCVLFLLYISCVPCLSCIKIV